MQKILLVNAPVSINSPKTAFPPLSLLILGNVLGEIKKDGKLFDYELIDLDLRLKQGAFQDTQKFFMKAAEVLVERNPSVCMFTTHGYNIAIVLELSEMVKRLRPACSIVLGGVTATLSAESIIEEFSHVDVVIKGAGEPALPALIEALLRKNDYASVPSAVYMSGGRVVSNPESLPQPKTPFYSPEYALIDLEEYVEHNRKHAYIRPGFVLVESGRGCCWNCTFCAPAKMWKSRVRYRKISEIIDEMRFLAAKGLDFTFFTQDNLDEKFLFELSTELIREEVGIEWGCYARIHPLSIDLIDLMSLAGCRLVFTGLETPNPSAQKFSRKKLEMADVLNRVKHFNRNGIRLVASFIAGFPDETDADLENTMRLALECSGGATLDSMRSACLADDFFELPTTRANFSTIHPLMHMPGTDSYQLLGPTLRFTEHPTHHDSFGSYLFGDRDFQRRHFDKIYSPFATHLPEDMTHELLSALRMFNFLNGRPWFVAKLAVTRSSSLLKLTRELISRLGEDFVLTANIKDFEDAAGALVGKLLGLQLHWTAERVAEPKNQEKKSVEVAIN